jgi:hypothetical protein
LITHDQDAIIGERDTHLYTVWVSVRTKGLQLEVDVKMVGVGFIHECKNLRSIWDFRSTILFLKKLLKSHGQCPQRGQPKMLAHFGHAGRREERLSALIGKAGERKTNEAGGKYNYLWIFFRVRGVTLRAGPALGLRRA